MKFIKIAIILFVTVGGAFGQALNIEKAYPASVKIIGFDTVRKMQNSSQFSGVVVSADGHILTAAHAIRPNRTYKVLFPDGNTCIAVGLGRIDLAATPTQPDVAMMKITTPGKWPYAEMGWSSAIQKGQVCISISYPETLTQPLPSVRFGHIVDTLNQWGFIQSTCAMEPGDSGGGLYDELGRLIGLHSRCDVSEDVNYEIPVDYYRKYWTALQEPKTYTTFPDIIDQVRTDPQVSQLNFHNPPVVGSYGSKVTISSEGKQISGTLIEPLGVKSGKIIISKSSAVGNVPVISGLKVWIIARDPENDLVILGFDGKLSGGIKVDINSTDTLQFAKLGAALRLPGPGILSTLPFPLPSKYSTGVLGATPAIKEGKLVLSRLQRNSPASRDSMMVGDVIHTINGKTVNTPEDMQLSLEKYAPDDKISIAFERNGEAMTREVTLGARPMADPGHAAGKVPGGTSVRKDGFPRVFATDARLHPEECGGPVIDDKGNFLGISIARFSRTTTLVIPVQQIRHILKKHLN